MVFAGYSGFLHFLQLASHELATIGINETKNEIQNQTTIAAATTTTTQNLNKKYVQLLINVHLNFIRKSLISAFPLLKVVMVSRQSHFETGLDKKREEIETQCNLATLIYNYRLTFLMKHDYLFRKHPASLQSDPYYPLRNSNHERSY